MGPARTAPASLCLAPPPAIRRYPVLGSRRYLLLLPASLSQP
ncbi:hypothetical protein PSPO01_13591 [Paraphaeosphaeria sporulosa]